MAWCDESDQDSPNHTVLFKDPQLALCLGLKRYSRNVRKEIQRLALCFNESTQAWRQVQGCRFDQGALFNRRPQVQNSTWSLVLRCVAPKEREVITATVNKKKCVNERKLVHWKKSTTKSPPTLQEFVSASNNVASTLLADQHGVHVAWPFKELVPASNHAKAT